MQCEVNQLKTVRKINETETNEINLLTHDIFYTHSAKYSSSILDA